MTFNSDYSDIMPIDAIPDWEKRLARQDAFWQGEIIDRPVVNMSCPREKKLAKPPPPKDWASTRERWFDVDYLADCTVARIKNTEYFGDALPHIFPNLGPELFSAFFGSSLEFSETTSWSIPILKDWADADTLQFSTDNEYWKQLEKMTRILLDAGRNLFYTGISDIHPGGDAVAAFRDPMTFCFDMIEHPEEAKKMLDRVGDVYAWVFDYYYDWLVREKQAISSWPGMVSTKKWYVPSNDFSCMVSEKVFEEIFLPELIKEIQQLEASIYHLDGPQALRHLDALLAIPELSAIQWIYGTGNGRSSDWMAVYKKCQQAGKGLQLTLGLDEVDFFMENLRPEGLWITVYGIGNREEAEAMIKKISKWPR